MQENGKSGRDAVNLRAASWVVRADLGCTAAEQAELEAWLAEDPAHEVAFEREALAWERTGRLRALGRQDRKPDPNLLAGDPFVERRARPPRAPPWRLAAAAVLAVATAGAGYLWFGASTAYATAVGERRVVVLGDGSRLELNTDTRISVRLTPAGRRVRLARGEALFDVRPERRPFTVVAQDEQVRAVGTAFSVRLDRDDVKVLVVSGSVDVTGHAGPDNAPFFNRLVAGRIATYGSGGSTVHTAAAGEANRALSWRYGAISLAGETLDQAAAEFNRYNAKQLVVSDRAAASVRLGGYFQQNDVDGFARALKSSFDIKVVDTGRAIYLSAGPRLRLSGAARQPAAGS